jgi:hypothetical protein
MALPSLRPSRLLGVLSLRFATPRNRRAEPARPNPWSTHGGSSQSWIKGRTGILSLDPNSDKPACHPTPTQPPKRDDVSGRVDRAEPCKGCRSPSQQLQNSHPFPEPTAKLRASRTSTAHGSGLPTAAGRWPDGCRNWQREREGGDLQVLTKLNFYVTIVVSHAEADHTGHQRRPAGHIAPAAAKALPTTNPSSPTRPPTGPCLDRCCWGASAWQCAARSPEGPGPAERAPARLREHAVNDCRASFGILG